MKEFEVTITETLQKSITVEAATKMKKYLERDEVQLLALTESTLAKLGTMTDEEFGQLELYPDFDI